MTRFDSLIFFFLSFFSSFPVKYFLIHKVLKSLTYISICRYIKIIDPCCHIYRNVAKKAETLCYKQSQPSQGGYQSTMGRSGVMLFVAISTITISQAWGACSDFTCTYKPTQGGQGNLKEVMTVDTGDKCAYNTQEGDRYPPPRGEQGTKLWNQ